MRQGFRLCSHRDPVAEAQEWARSIQVSSGLTLIVLGVGAGFHMAALKNMFPKDKICGVDFDPLTLENLSIDIEKKLISEQFEAHHIFETLILPNLKSGYRVLSFKASWVCLEQPFRRIENYLLGHQGECNPLISSDPGLRKAFFSVPLDTEVNIKSMTRDEAAPSSIRWRRLRALRELVS